MVNMHICLSLHFFTYAALVLDIQIAEAALVLDLQVARAALARKNFYKNVMWKFNQIVYLHPALFCLTTVQSHHVLESVMMNALQYCGSYTKKL